MEFGEHWRHGPWLYIQCIEEATPVSKAGKLYSWWTTGLWWLVKGTHIRSLNSLDSSTLVFVLLKSTWPHRSLSSWPWHTWYIHKVASPDKSSSLWVLLHAQACMCTAMCVYSVYILRLLNAGYIHISMDWNCQARRSNTHPHMYVLKYFWLKTFASSFWFSASHVLYYQSVCIVGVPLFSLYCIVNNFVSYKLYQHRARVHYSLYLCTYSTHYTVKTL